MMRSVPSTPRWLGLFGLLPMLGCLGYAVAGEAEWADLARAAGGLYSGLILSFLGGAWWGIAAAAPAAEGRGTLGWVWVAAVSPSVVAMAAGLWWLADPARPEPSLVTLGFALLASPLIDLRLKQMGLTPRWWLRLRWPLSLALGAATLALAYV